MPVNSIQVIVTGKERIFFFCNVKVSMDTQHNLEVNRSYGYYKMTCNKRHSDKDSTTHTTTQNPLSGIMKFHSDQVPKYKL